MSIFRGLSTQRLEKFRSKAIASFPVIALIGSLVFYGMLFQSWNSAPVFSGHTIEAGLEYSFSSAVDVCRVSPSKIQVEAWVALKGHARRAHNSLLLIRDDQSGEHLRMKSRVVLRPGVSQALNERYGDDIDYVGTGLQGSLNFQRGGRALTHGQVVAAYDTGRGFVLLELPCKF